HTAAARMRGGPPRAGRAGPDLHGDAVTAMSLLQELGAQLRATSDELPTGLVTVAMERLRSATELLNWVRQTSVDPIGVPQLGNATEHAEHASAALRIAQDAIASYLAG